MVTQPFEVDGPPGTSAELKITLKDNSHAQLGPSPCRRTIELPLTINATKRS